MKNNKRGLGAEKQKKIPRPEKPDNQYPDNKTKTVSFIDYLRKGVHIDAFILRSLFYVVLVIGRINVMNKYGNHMCCLILCCPFCLKQCYVIHTNVHVLIMLHCICQPSEKKISKKMRKLQEFEKKLQEKEFERAFFREFWPDNV